jgi:hypothetical protein
VKRSSIVIFSIIAGYVLAILLSVALLLAGIDMPATLAKSPSEHNMYGNVEGLLLTIGLSWAIYQVLVRRFPEKKTPESTLTESSPVASEVERRPQIPLAGMPSPVQPAFCGPLSSPVADSVELHTVASANAQPTSGPRKKKWTRPTPLVWAVGAALAWGILSVGPARLAEDMSYVIPRDEVTSPFKWVGATRVLTDAQCYEQTHGFAVPIPLMSNLRRLEDDGMCHLRSGGHVDALLSDVVRGGQNGLLAFLAVGAALLLWPRLRAAMLESPPTQAALRAPTLDLGTSDQSAVRPGETIGDKLRQLATLRDDGIISSEEFEAKKAELLRSF